MLSHWRIHINLAILVVPDVIVAQLVLIIKTWTGYKIWLGCSCLYVSSCKWAPENSNKGTIKTDKSQPLCLGARPCREQWAPALRTYFHLFSECPAQCSLYLLFLISSKCMKLLSSKEFFHLLKQMYNFIPFCSKFDH